MGEIYESDLTSLCMIQMVENFAVLSHKIIYLESFRNLVQHRGCSTLVSGQHPCLIVW